MQARLQATTKSYEPPSKSPGVSIWYIRRCRGHHSATFCGLNANRQCPRPRNNEYLSQPAITIPYIETRSPFHIVLGPSGNTKYSQTGPLSKGFRMLVREETHSHPRVQVMAFGA